MGLRQKKQVHQLPDEELLVGLGNRKAMQCWGVLYERYAPLCLGVCLKYLKDRALAEDATMEIFEALPEKAMKSEVRNFRSWFHTVVRNHCLMKIRKRDPLAEAGELPELGGSISDDDELTKEGLLNGMAQCLTSLKDEQKVCVEKFYLEEKSYQDISAETGYELKKVKSYIQNGKRNLKICMERKEAANE